VGRPREHDEQTRVALRAAAERIVAEGGAGALSVRAVADAAHTSTRAVYSVFGSKEGLVDALAQTAFEFLFSEVEALPATPDPVADLVAVGHVFQQLVREHPALYRIAFQRVVPSLRARPELTAARERALAGLRGSIRRLDEAGLLGRTSVGDATVAYEAVMEGLANAELRGATLRILPAGEEDRAWDQALRNVIRGFRAAGVDRSDARSEGAGEPPRRSVW
jgi:AcrR family transcriptional regulator